MEGSGGCVPMRNEAPAGSKKTSVTKRSWNRRESAVVRFAISCRSIADAVEAEFGARGINITFSERAIGRVSQIVSQTVEKQYAKDLYTFAHHAKRIVPNANDARLLYHRNPSVEQRVEDLVRTFDAMVPDKGAHGMVSAQRVPVVQSTIFEIENTEECLQEAIGSDDNTEPETKRLNDQMIADFGDQPLTFSTSKSLGLDVAYDENMKLTESKEDAEKQVVADVNDPFYDDDIAWIQTPKKPKTALSESASGTSRTSKIMSQKKTPEILTTPQRPVPVDDSFYNDDDISWAKVVTKPPETESPQAMAAETGKKNTTPELKATSSTAVNEVEPLAVVTTPRPCEAEIYDWFRPDSHSTPLGAAIPEKNETINLSLLFTPQTPGLSSSVPNKKTAIQPVRAKVAGLRRLSKKPPT